MERQKFWNEVDRIAKEWNVARHPYVELVRSGKATREQIRKFAVEHYHMTVRDSSPLAARCFLELRELDGEAAVKMADSFAEEAMGLHTKTAGHEALLFEFWQKGLKCAAPELTESRGSDASRMYNAYVWRLMVQMPKFVGAVGMGEAAFSETCEKLFEGLTSKYGLSPDVLRFFSGHIEADREHGETGKELTERLLRNETDREQFLDEARCISELYWKGYDAMM